MDDEARRGHHPDVEVTVRRADTPAASRLRRRRAPTAARVGPPARSRRPVAALVLLAAAAVIVALLAAGMNARDGARSAAADRDAAAAAAAAKRSSDFATVLALHERIFGAFRATARTWRADRGRGASPAARHRLVTAVAPLEDVAFVLRRDLTPIPHAADIWARYLVCAYYTARSAVGARLDADVPELADFARARRPAIGARECGTVVLPARS